MIRGGLFLVPQTLSAFHPHAQRNAFRRRDTRQDESDYGFGGTDAFGEAVVSDAGTDFGGAASRLLIALEWLLITFVSDD